jgi:hypothetical protein
VASAVLHEYEAAFKEKYFEEDRLCSAEVSGW